MMKLITLPTPPVCEREILRYAMCRHTDDCTQALLDKALREALPVCTYRVCAMEVPLAIEGNTVDLGVLTVKSRALAKLLQNSNQAVMFAATIGIPFDRLLSKYVQLSPSKALMLDAIGTERIEALCDAFCETLCNRGNCTPRFSPGYGDLPLSAQRDIVRVLDTPKHLGLSLSDSLLMTPTKSVTAIVGLGGDKQISPTHSCKSCDKRDCAYRRD